MDHPASEDCVSICARCQTREERPCHYTARTREYYRVTIAALRYVAERCGYALAVHGSLKTDIDLLAVPWRESAVSAAFLAEEIRLTLERIVGHAKIPEYERGRLPEQKPCGRLAWSFYLQPEGVDGPYVDLSVMPVSTPPVPAPPAAAKRKRKTK